MNISLYQVVLMTIAMFFCISMYSLIMHIVKTPHSSPLDQRQALATVMMMIMFLCKNLSMIDSANEIGSQLGQNANVWFSPVIWIKKYSPTKNFILNMNFDSAGTGEGNGLYLLVIVVLLLVVMLLLVVILIMYLFSPRK